MPWNIQNYSIILILLCFLYPFMVLFPKYVWFYFPKGIASPRNLAAPLQVCVFWYPSLTHQLTFLIISNDLLIPLLYGLHPYLALCLLGCYFPLVFLSSTHTKYLWSRQHQTDNWCCSHRPFPLEAWTSRLSRWCYLWTLVHSSGRWRLPSFHLHCKWTATLKRQFALEMGRTKELLSENCLRTARHRVGRNGTRMHDTSLLWLYLKKFLSKVSNLCINLTLLKNLSLQFDCWKPFTH